jgi:GT2 family glycosyltransferase
MTAPHISLVSTVLNEIDTIGEFLSAIEGQSLRPDDIIIVDAGSRDGTIAFIREAQQRYQNLTLIVEPGCTIARGRNIAIQRSSGDIIAVTDAGARAGEFWLENIVAPLIATPPSDVAAGWYEPDPRTPFERLVSRIQPPVSSIDPDAFLPSARSLAFKRTCWERVGGFPEELTNWGEDTLFARRLRSAGCAVKFVPDAVVRWRPRSDLGSFARQFLNYGRGDAEAGLDRLLNFKRAAFLAGCAAMVVGFFVSLPAFLLGLLIFLAGSFRLLMPLTDARGGWPSVIGLLPLLIVRESSQVAGYLVGLLTGRKTKR